MPNIKNVSIELRYSDWPDIKTDEFREILDSIEIINKLSLDIVEKGNFSSNKVDNYLEIKFPEENQAKILKISKTSPLVIEIVFSSIAAVWVLIQIAEKIANWKLERKLLEAQVEKLDFENKKEYKRVMRYKDKVQKELDSNEDLVKKIKNKTEKSRYGIEGANVKDEWNHGLQKEELAH